MVVPPLVLSQQNYSERPDDKKQQGKVAGQDNDLTNPFMGWDKTAMDVFLNGHQLIQGNFGSDPVEGYGYNN